MKRKKEKKIKSKKNRHSSKPAKSARASSKARSFQKKSVSASKEKSSKTKLKSASSDRASKTQTQPVTKEKPFKREKDEILAREAILETSVERRKQPRDDDGEGASENSPESEQTLDRTPMKIYLKQIEHIPLLTPEDELQLATHIQSNDDQSEACRHRMIRSNLRLVISIAKRYSNMGLSFSDLVEEGNIGLMRAVEKFNPERGYRFSTYASWWIKQAIMRALSNQGKTIRIPVYMYDVISKWRRVRDGLMQRLNRVPTRKEIAKVMQVPVQKIKEIENIAGRPSSLNAPVSLDGTAELMDLIEDDRSHSPDSQIGEALKNERLSRLMDQLDERERRILILRFGLGNEEPHTLEEVAQEFGITRERVRQIEAASLKKVRTMLESENDRLENYLIQ